MFDCQNSFGFAQGCRPICLSPVGFVGNIQRADERTGQEFCLRGLGHRLPGPVLLPPGLYLGQAGLDLGQGLGHPALPNVDAQSL